MKSFIIAFIVAGLFFSLWAAESFAASAKKSHTSKKSYTNGDSNSPIDYVRTNIIIMRKSMPKPTPDTTQPMPWQDSSIIRPTPEETELEDPSLVFDVEIRDGMSLYNQSGWFNLSSYSDRTGVMMVFAKPGIKPIIRSTQYAPVDILFIDKQGNITQIAPNINLSEIDEEIYPSAPILAFLFLKGGTCADMHINVGDEIQYSLFKKSPLILNSPPPKEPPPVDIKPPAIHEKF